MIVTLAELKAELGIADTADNNALTQLISAIQGRFEDLCGRRFDRAERTERHNGGTSFINLRAFPVETVAEVKHIAPDGTETVYEQGSDFYLVTYRGRILTEQRVPFPEGVESMSVRYTGGFVPAGTSPQAGQYAMPDGLRRVFFMHAASEHRNRTNLGLTSVKAQGSSISLSPAALLPEVRDGLAEYRRL